MWTFFIALVLLFVGFFAYSRFAEKVFVPDKRLTPAIASPDGIDKIPLRKSKAFLIELLNIAGTGPIFGAISGALFGPIAFIWIVLGCIFGGAVHDYFSGMISSRHDGASIVALTGKYMGKIAKLIMTFFSILLLILVTAVFVVSPASLLQDLTSGMMPAAIWLIIILAYYLLAAILPIDKIIGKIYPLFGIILMVMAVSVILGVMINKSSYPMIELIGNLKDFSHSHGRIPWWPFMLITIACGAVSGFHATQTPMVAKCIKNEKEGRHIFYGAMVAEGVIALIWAAAAMAFFHVDGLNESTIMFNNQEISLTWKGLCDMGGGCSRSVNIIATTLLGPIGTILAIVGVIICPITSGDTALRSARLIISEWFKLDQKKIRNRLILTIPLFGLVICLALWNFIDPKNFNILWCWFAWSNQTMAALSLWISTIYLLKKGKYLCGSLLTMFPAVFMTIVIVAYIFGEPNISLGRWIPLYVANIIAEVVGAGLLVWFLCVFFIHIKNHFNHSYNCKSKKTYSNE